MRIATDDAPEVVLADAVSAEPVLPPYQGISLAHVRLVRSDSEAAAALEVLLAADAIGFDTESKPTFMKGEKSTGPHLIQLATDGTAYLFQIGAEPVPHLLDTIKTILESPA